MKVKEENEKAGLKLNIQKMKIMASYPITSWQIDERNNGNSDRLYFLGLQKSLWTETVAMKLKTLSPWKKSYDKPRQCIKKLRHYFVDKGMYSQNCGFPSSHVQM